MVVTIDLLWWLKAMGVVAAGCLAALGFLVLLADYLEE
jgi:hypothetical protein